jgi:hypothetical protein
LRVLVLIVVPSLSSPSATTMMNSTVDDEDFPPNPFRSGPPPQQQPMQQMQPTAQHPMMQQPQYQQQPMMQQAQVMQQPVQEEEDFFSNQISAPITMTPSPMTSMNNNTPLQGSMQAGNTMQAPPPPRSRWQACMACCTMQTYQQYFDIDTLDIATRIKGSVTTFYRPDYFRTSILGSQRSDELKGPDLYGPFWIIMTLVFLLGVRQYCTI